MPPSIILVAGTPGTETTSASQRIVDHANAQAEAPRWYAHRKFEDVLLDEYNATNKPPIRTIIPLFQVPKPVLREIWNKTLDRLLRELRDEVPDDTGMVLLPIHLVWFHHRLRDYINVLHPGEITTRLEPYKVSSVLCLIDDIHDVYTRLTAPGRLYDPRVRALSEKQIGDGHVFRRHIQLLDWRRREIAEGEALANQLRCRFTLLAVKHQRSVAYRCTLGQPQVYLPHPITELRRLERSENSENRELNALFRQSLWEFQQFVGARVPLIQPTCIDEYRHVVTEAGIGLRPRFYPRDRYADALAKPVAEPASEIFVPNGEGPRMAVARHMAEIAESYIEFQVTSRDLQLVTQADSLVLYRPAFNGAISAGVWEEISYFDRITRMMQRASRRVFVLDSQFDQSRLAPRQFLERLIDASDKKLWSVDLDKNVVCDYLAQLSEETRSTINNAAESKDLKLAGDAVNMLLRDIGEDTEWSLLSEAKLQPLSPAGTFPHAFASLEEFFRALTDFTVPKEVRSVYEGAKHISLDDKSPQEVAEEIVNNLAEKQKA